MNGGVSSVEVATTVSEKLDSNFLSQAVSSGFVSSFVALLDTDGCCIFVTSK